MASKVLTIVFTDIKGFTERTSGSDREFAVRLRAKHDELLKPIVAQYEGKLVKTIGDAFLLTYESPTNAVLSALMMQETLRKYNTGAKPEERIEIRVAINTGEVSVQAGDILGEPVNVASRVEGITEANEVWFTEATYLAMNKQEVPTSLVGDFRLKGVPEAMKVYRVVQDPGSVAFQQVLQVQHQWMKDRESIAQGKTSSSFWWAVALVFALIMTVGMYFWTMAMQDREMLKTADVAISAGRLEEAEQLLLALSKRDSLNPAFRALASQFLLIKIRQETVKGNIEAGKLVLNSFYKQYSFLQPHRRAEATLEIARAFQLYNAGDKDAAMNVVDSLALTDKDRVESLLDVFHFYDKTGIHWMRPFQLLVQIEKLDPGAIASEPAFGGEVDYYLEKVAPEDGIEGFFGIIVRHYRDPAKKKLEAALYDPDPAKRTLRWNARSYLPRFASSSVDLFRFFACDLATPEPDVYTPQFSETVLFFQKPDVKGELWAGPLPTEKPAWIASLVPLIENAQREVEKKAGEWARMNQDVASYTLFLTSCQTALGILKSQN